MKCISNLSRTLFVLIFLFVSTVHSSIAQEILLPSGESIDSIEYKRLSALGERLFAIGDSLEGYREFDGMFKKYKEAMRLFDSIANWKRSAEIRNIYAYSLIDMNEPEGLLQLDTVKNILIEHNDTISSLYAMVYYNQGVHYGNASDYSRSLSMYHRGVEILKTAESDTSEFLNLFLSRLGFTYGKLSDLNKQIEYYEESYKTLQGQKPDSGMAYALLGLTSCYKRAGRFKDALNSVLKSKEILIELYGPDYPQLMASYYWIANVYVSMQETEKAKEADEEVMRIADNILSKGYTHTAVMHGAIVTNRLAYYEKSNNIIEKYFDKLGPGLRSKVLDISASNYIKLGQHQKAHRVIDESIQILDEVFPSGISPEIASLYRRKSDIERDLKDYTSALNSIQNALRANSVEFDNMDLKSNPSFKTDCIDNIICLTYIFNKANYAWKEYKESKDPKYLELADHCIQDDIDNFDFLMQSLPNAQSRQDLFRVYADVFDVACEINYEQYEQTNDPKYISNIFEYIEYSKSIGLRETLLQLNSSDLSTIPKQYAEQLDSIGIKLTRLDSEKKSLVSQNKADEVSVLQSKIEDLLAEQTNIYSKIDFGGKPASSIFGTEPLVSFDAFRETLGDRGFLSIMQGLEQLFVLYMDRENVVPLQIDYSDSKDEMLIDLYAALSDPNVDNWREKSHLVYATFFGKIQEAGITIKDELIISPDGRFSKIPFETLKYENENDEGLWLNRHNISYAYSANVHIAQNRTHGANKFIAGFSADYNNPSIETLDTITNAPLASLVRSGVYTLPGANREVQSVVDLFKGDAFLHTTPSLFKREASKYKILHLATHGLISDNNPMESSFLLEPNPTDSNNKLRAADLYEMNLNASLAVLSACDSGVGKLTKGEGVMSLARAFAYTGVPSSVMTLWKVADAPSSDLMLGFYENIKSEQKINTSLTNAKQNFIQNAGAPSLTHPYYWAGYVAIGDTSKIDAGTQGVWKKYTWVLGLLAGIFIFRFVSNRNKKVNNS